MPSRVPTLVINSPAPNAVVGAQPFNVAGLVTAPGMPEPVAINSVTVQVDAQPPVRATLKRIPNKQLVEVTFTATVQITVGQDPHTVTVTVTSDAGVPVSHGVTVNVGPRFAAPSLLIDLATVGNVDPNSVSVQKMVQNISTQVASLPLINQLQNVNKIVVGPNVLLVTNPRPMLRIALWILDANFPVSELVAASADFPLRRLTSDAAQGSFGLAPLLNAPPPSTVPPADDPMFGFAFSVPSDTLQWVVDANFSDIAAQGASNHFTIESATITTDTSGSVITTLSGSLPLGIGMTATLTETLGIAQRPGTEQFMPVVRASSNSVSVGSAVDWVVGVLIPAVGIVLAGAFGLASYGVGQASGQANGIISSFLGQLPARIPFRNSDLPVDVQSKYLFPMAVLNFESFTTDGTGIIGSGTVSLGARDQSMLSVVLTGPTYFPNYSYGIESFYSVLLSHFEPDNDQMTWMVSGGAAKNETVTIDEFWQLGGFSTGFSLPLKPAPGKYHFTINVSGTETCATDPTKQLTGSASLTVTANVVKGGQPALQKN